ncbi:MAG: TIGR02757 family protein [Bacteroidetes bacterium]|nr:TIGR02757 family protein [Bacteroidota bacterium]
MFDPSDTELRYLLETSVQRFNTFTFIETDPVSIPHLFTARADIEIAGFLAATIAWGQRPVILRNALQLMQRMDMAPAQFVLHADARELKHLNGFVHRTFNGEDARTLVLGLRHLYKKHGGPEAVFANALRQGNMAQAISTFRAALLEKPHPARSRKHVADPAAGSSAKRINMWLRWMVRSDKAGVDFGLWKNLSPALLHCPLDLHSGNVARKLGLLQRTQNDWKAVEELTANLRLLDAKDPVKYDFALFGLGVFDGVK